MEMVIHNVSFDDWLAELDRQAGDLYGRGKCSENTGRDCWLCYYDSGYKPEDAIAEDQSYD